MITYRIDVVEAYPRHTALSRALDFVRSDRWRWSVTDTVLDRELGTGTAATQKRAGAAAESFADRYETKLSRVYVPRTRPRTHLRRTRLMGREQQWPDGD